MNLSLLNLLKLSDFTARQRCGENWRAAGHHHHRQEGERLAEDQIGEECIEVQEEEQLVEDNHRNFHILRRKRVDCTR